MISLLVAATALLGVDAEFEAFFQEFTQKRGEIQTLEATFTQVNINPDDSYESSGVIKYAQPRQLLFTYAEPDRQHILFSGDKLYEYDVELEQLVVRNIADLKEVETLFLAFENNPERLRSLYEVAVATPSTDAEEGCNGRVIILKPKVSGDEQPLFQRVELYLREQDFLPCRVHVDNDNDTEFFIDIEYESINEGSQGAISYFLDEGVTIVEDDIVTSITEEAGMRVPEDIESK